MIHVVYLQLHDVQTNKGWSRYHVKIVMKSTTECKHLRIFQYRLPCCSFWFPKWWSRAAQNFYKASEHLLRKLEELHTAQPSSLETTHENHSTDMNIFSFNTQVSRSRPWAVKFCHSNELFKRVTDFPSITLKIVFVTSGGSPTMRIGI